MCGKNLMKTRWPLVLGAVLAFGLLASTVFKFARSRMGEASDAQSRKAAFQEIFGSPAPGDVRSVASSWYRSGDIYIRWIRVGCGPQTIELVRARKRVEPSRYQVFQTTPGASHPPAPKIVLKLWLDSRDAIPSWWIDAADMPMNPERFTLGWRTSSKQDLVFVWLDASTGVVYAARNVSEYQ
jgi:hypothetical protein